MIRLAPLLASTTLVGLLLPGCGADRSSEGASSEAVSDSSPTAVATGGIKYWVAPMDPTFISDSPLSVSGSDSSASLKRSLFVLCMGF